MTKFFGKLLQKVGVFTVFEIGLLGVSAAVLYGKQLWEMQSVTTGRGLLFEAPIWELGLAGLICWFFDVLSIFFVERARQKSKHDISGVWAGIIYRLGGPLSAMVVLMFFLEPKTFERLIACLVFVYLVSLPVAVYLTLPEANRQIEPQSPEL